MFLLLIYSGIERFLGHNLGVTCAFFVVELFMWSLRSFAAALYVSTENTSVMGLLLLFVCCCCVVDDLQRDWTLPRPKPWCQVLCCFCCWIVYVELEIFLSDIERFHGKHLGHGLAVVAGIIIFVQFYAANILLNFKSHTFFWFFIGERTLIHMGKNADKRGRQILQV